MEITQEFVDKLLEAVDAGLVQGVGKPVPGQMCVEAAVCYAMGLPHGDKPTCVHSSIRALKIELNDSYWSSPAARAKGMRKLAILQLGTADTDFPAVRFAELVTLALVNKILPIELRRNGQEEEASACERAETLTEAKEAIKNAADAYTAVMAYTAAAVAYVEDAAVAAAVAVAVADADAAVAVAVAADAAAAVAVAYVEDAAVAADSVLTLFATLVENILIDLKVPAAPFVEAIQ